MCGVHRCQNVITARNVWTFDKKRKCPDLLELEKIFQIINHARINVFDWKRWESLSTVCLAQEQNKIHEDKMAPG